MQKGLRELQVLKVRYCLLCWGSLLVDLDGEERRGGYLVVDEVG